MLRFGVIAAMLISPALAHAEESDDEGKHRHRRPVYQRRAFEWTPKHDRWNGRGFGHRWTEPQVSSGWFQRPYPYHLDYYKMRYGGSYAPYFGNLYGPPQVVTAPPYYGPYYGGYELGHPQAHGPIGAEYGPPVEESIEKELPSETTSNESLPLLPP
jgi:hypothetical protein